MQLPVRPATSCARLSRYSCVAQRCFGPALDEEMTDHVGVIEAYTSKSVLTALRQPNGERYARDTVVVARCQNATHRFAIRRNAVSTLFELYLL